MSIKYSDVEIANLLQERKPLDQDFRSKIQLRSKRGHKERELDVKGDNRNDFRLILRQSSHNALDFSIILAYCPTQSNQMFRLRRYNGKSHEHTNTMESQTFDGFHIHTATERYQESGLREDAYAEPTTRYSDFNSAVNCMLHDCGFNVPGDRDPQQIPFEET